MYNYNSLFCKDPVCTVVRIRGREAMLIEKDALVESVRRSFPDLRSINKLQGFKATPTRSGWACTSVESGHKSQPISAQHPLLFLKATPST